MEIIAAMVIAFILGAYIRQPFPLTIRKKEWMSELPFPEMKKPLEIDPLIRQEAIQDEKRKSIDRATQMENMWNYTERVALEKDKEADI